MDGFRGFYPGSKVPLPTEPIEQPKPEKPEVAWDSRPYVKKVRGKEVEFFALGAVCTALGKSAVTIRNWIRQGHLPQASFRLPEKNGIKGRRLYTRAQIEALVRVAEAHKIVGSVRVDWSKHQSFASEVREAWAALPPL